MGLQVTPPGWSGSASAAFTLIELVCVIGIIGVLAALLLPAVSKSSESAKRARCANNLRQVGIAFHSFAHDHNSRFPMAIARDAGGSMEFVENAYRVGGDFYFGFRHFQVLSNELSTPKLLICPSDKRLPADTFSDLKNENLSYFVGLRSTFDQPRSILAGDRNVRVAASPGKTLLKLESGEFLRWTAELHQFRGNLLFADAHVEHRQDYRPADTLVSLSGTVDLVLPSVKEPTMPTGTSPSTEPPDGHPAQGPNSAVAPPPSPMAPVSSEPASNTMPNTVTHETGSGGLITSVPPGAHGVALTGREAISNISPGAAPASLTAASSPDEGISPLATWLSEKFEPFIRKFGLLLYLVLVLLVITSLILKYSINRKTRSPKPLRSD